MNTSSAAAPLVDCAELAARLGSPRLLLVDCRYELGNPAWGAQVHATGHIAGAHFASMDTQLSGPRAPGSGRHPLPTAAQFAATLGSWGFHAGSQVVAYDQGNGACAARLWWMLRARGHAFVQVLDGGLAAWQAAGLPLTTAQPVAQATQVEPRGFAGVLGSADVAQALAHGAITLVDARGADRFAGQNETIDPVAGHVPGAVNHPFLRNLGADLRFLDAAALRRVWAPILQRALRAPIVAMCGSGITACHNLLALERMGVADSRIYAGSFSEWITDPQRPVATGE